MHNFSILVFQVMFIYQQVHHIVQLNQGLMDQSNFFCFSDMHSRYLFALIIIMQQFTILHKITILRNALKETNLQQLVDLCEELLYEIDYPQYIQRLFTIEEKNEHLQRMINIRKGGDFFQILERCEQENNKLTIQLNESYKTNYGLLKDIRNLQNIINVISNNQDEYQHLLQKIKVLQQQKIEIKQRYD
ncbi:hypothetical protein pb186bvf_016156 [Paramecium bursaria]